MNFFLMTKKRCWKDFFIEKKNLWLFVKKENVNYGN